MDHPSTPHGHPASSAHEPSEPHNRRPHLALLHADMFLSGFGMVLLGPVLPALAANAHAADSGSGLFFTAQFIGAFLGGMTTSGRLWRSLIRGSAAAALGFFLLALCVQQHASVGRDAAALLPLGFGVGQMLTSVNLLVSERFAERRGSALSLVNLSLSLGAMTGPLLLGLLLPITGLGTTLYGAAALFTAACATAVWNARSGQAQPLVQHGAQQASRLPPPAFLYFAILLIVYGGVETSMSGWLPTFGMRYGNGTASLSALSATALWTGITAGRALVPLALRRVSEGALLRGTLAAAAVLVLALSRVHGATAILLAALLLGLAMAPWFPLVLSAMLGEGAAAGQVGTIIAVSGLGAATLPLLVGTLSRNTGSLRIAFIALLFGLLLLLGLSFRATRQGAPSI